MAVNPRDITPMTLEDLRAILSDEIHKIREGQTSAASVNAISNATGKILSTVKLEMEYCRLTGRTPNIPLLAALPEPVDRRAETNGQVKARGE